MNSRNPSLLSNSGPPRRAAALPNRPNCIVSPSDAESQSSSTADASAVSNDLLDHALLSPPPATASAEGAQLNGRPFLLEEGALGTAPPWPIWAVASRASRRWHLPSPAPYHVPAARTAL